MLSPQTQVLQDLDHKAQMQKLSPSARQYLANDWSHSWRPKGRRSPTGEVPVCDTQVATYSKTLGTEWTTFEFKSTFSSMQPVNFGLFVTLETIPDSYAKVVLMTRQNCFRDNYLSWPPPQKQQFPKPSPWKHPSELIASIQLGSSVRLGQSQLSARTHARTPQHPRLILYSRASISRQRPKLAGPCRSLLLLLSAHNGLFTAGSSLPIVYP